jgi:hypothetical protein
MVLAPVGPSPERPGPHLLLTTDSRADWLSWRAGLLVLLLMCGAVLLIRRFSAPPPPPPPPATDYLVYLTQPDAGIPASLAHGWVSGGSRKPSDGVAAIRVGARMVDLEAAALSRRRTGYAAWPGTATAIWAVFHDIPYVNWPIDRDASRAVRLESEHVSHFASELTDLLSNVPRGGNAAWAFMRVQNEAWDWVNLDDVADAHRASRVLPRDRVALGSWLEAARLAALRGDAKFFTWKDVRAEAARAPNTADLNDAQRAALRESIRLMDARTAGDFAMLAESLTRSLWVLAN